MTVSFNVPLRQQPHGQRRRCCLRGLCREPKVIKIVCFPNFSAQIKVSDSGWNRALFAFCLHLFTEFSGADTPVNRLRPKRYRVKGPALGHLLREVLIDLHGHLNIFMPRRCCTYFGEITFSVRIVANSSAINEII